MRNWVELFFSVWEKISDKMTDIKMKIKKFQILGNLICQKL